MKAIKVVSAGVCCLALMAACQSTGPRTVSVEEAKKITTTFKNEAFTPPPRKIEDVTRMLEAASDRNQDEMAKIRAKADGPAPTGSTPDERADSLRERAEAAAEIGRLQQSITDLKAALAENPSDKTLLTNTLMALSHAESSNGNMRAAIEAREKSLDVIRNQQRGVMKKNSRASVLAFYKAAVGDFKAADEYLGLAKFSLAEAKAIVVRTQGRSRIGNFIPINESLMTFSEAQIEHLLGRYENAETLFRRAMRLIDADIEANWQPDYQLSIYDMATSRKLIKNNIQRGLARTLARMGRFAEAEVVARDAVELAVSRFGRDSVYTARSIAPLIFVLGQTNRIEEARALSEISLKILTNLNVEPSGFTLNKARHFLANVMVAEEDWSGALQAFDEIGSAVGGDEVLLDRLYRFDLGRAVALIESGQPAKAADVTGPAAARLARLLGGKHFDAAEALGLHGVALQRQGNTTEALAAFRSAFPILTQRSRQTNSDGGAAASGRMRLILEGYLDALGASGGDGAAEEAFVVANAARARGVQEALARSAARAAITNPDLKDLVRREQDAQKQISALYGVLSNAMVDGGGSDSRQLRVAIDDLRVARAALMEEIEGRFPEYASIINPKPATIEQARAALGADEAVVAFYVADSRTYGWSFGKAGPVAFAATDLGLEDLDDTVAELRAALDPQAATLGEIPPFDTVLAHDLYKTLLGPVEAGWKPARHLLVVADGPLGHLPLSVLPTKPVTVAPDADLLFAEYRDVPWLAKTHATMVLPSVTSLATLRALPAGDPARKAFAGFGDPWFNAEQAKEAAAEKPVEVAMRGGLQVRGLPLKRRSVPSGTAEDSYTLKDLPRLPDTAAEVRSIAAALAADASTDVFLGGRANETTVKTLGLGDRKVLAFATHGLVPGELDGLTQPALALSAPQLSDGAGADDGLLTMDEIMALKLDADWVVLSACNTAAGDGGGAEAISGLGRAFFYAGARAILATGWPVETTSARKLTETLFARQAEDPSLSRADGLNAAQTEMISTGAAIDGQGKHVFAYAHPIFWAPFMLVGDGGTARPTS